MGEAYDVFFIEVGIVKPTVVRVIARMDIPYELSQEIVEACLTRSDYSELKSEIIVETFKDDYDFTVTVKPLTNDSYQSFIEKKIISPKLDSKTMKGTK